MKITFVGTGSGLVCKDRNPSCIVLSEGTDEIAIDCGDGTARAMLSANIDPSRLSAMTITHMHPDHSGGLAFFMQTLHLMKRTTPFRLFVPENPPFIREILEKSYIFPETIGFPLEIVEIDANTPYHFGAIELIARPNQHMSIHDKLLPKHTDLKSTAYSIEVLCKDSRMVYSSDILSMNDLEWIEGALDLLICEFTHIGAQEIDRFVEIHNIAKTVLTHIPENAVIPHKHDAAFDGYVIQL